MPEFINSAMSVESLVSEYYSEIIKTVYVRCIKSGIRMIISKKARNTPWASRQV